MKNNLLFNLDDVVITQKLSDRVPRPPNLEAENQALIALAQTMADSPQTSLQTLVESALHLCQADTAGISLLEKQPNGEEVFRWEALAGLYAERLNDTMPRNASPCGTTIDRNATQLMYMPERVFTTLRGEPPVLEALLVPFYFRHQPIGTVWVVAHHEERKFDREDERIVKTLAKFASAGWQLWKARDAAEVDARAQHQRSRDLARMNKSLQAQVLERDRTEGELQQLNQNLERRVENRTRERDVAHQRLRETQILTALGTASAKIIHDLANPLNSILTLVELQERYVATASDRLHELITGTTADLKAETARLQALMEDLRQFARPLQLKLEPVKLAMLTREVVQEAHFLQDRSAPLRLEQHLADSLPFAMADREKLSRVLLNLFKNAVEAMPEGGKLTLRCYQSGDKVCLEVEDTGSGIPKEINIFDPFVTSKPNGWGLGLAIVQQIISAHDGTIDWASDPGHGTTFTICLPVVSDVE